VVYQLGGGVATDLVEASIGGSLGAGDICTQRWVIKKKKTRKWGPRGEKGNPGYLQKAKKAWGAEKILGDRVLDSWEGYQRGGRWNPTGLTPERGEGKKG